MGYAGMPHFGVSILSDMEIDAEWLMVAKRCLLELRNGGVKPIPRDKVYAKNKNRFVK